MENIYKDLYQFSVYIPPMDFSIHQYLLASDPAILFAAGTVQQAEHVLPEIKSILGGSTLKYIFVSHMESDECGGISVFLKEYPDVTVICSALCARELPGYGYQGKIVVGEPKSTLSDTDMELQFFNYPSEVHLQDGLVCYEKNSGIFYSADLMLRIGDGRGKTVTKTWKQEVAAINTERIPEPHRLEILKKELLQISPSFIAVGHGFCVECNNAFIPCTGN